ncbi:hypothetical protein PFISCL1PPCAC_6200 [Pristionchus fissidentatus]|uniref:Sarcoglycan complex subunit protein n=1 Tax=Pristionchus fissidentatus TaxID=1538716 RepID=A0AAV5V9G8_9BILA|nr:hypothetical protein PFISCL1PPCAC_6200 [Pristionchus fissidentatus]
MSRYPMYGVQDEQAPVWSRGGSVLESQGGQQGYNPYGYSPHMGQHTTIIHSHTKPQSDASIYKVGIYGWRKRCLYGFILLLTIFVVLNIALTLWIMSVLDFSSEGMGALKMDEDGVRVTGRAQFDLPVHFSQLSTARDEALTIDSYRGVHLQSRNLSGEISSRFSLGQEGRTTAVCDKFEIFDKSNKLLFYADSNEVGLKLENLRILDEGGSVFEGAIQTSLLRPEADTPLRLESPTRGIVIDAAQDIEVLSSAGEINVNSLLDMNIVSKQGKIRLESSSIYVEGMARSNGRGVNHYQVCICQNGRLFMAEQGADCRADRSICA